MTSIRYPCTFALPKFGSSGEPTGTNGAPAPGTASSPPSPDAWHAYGRSMSPTSSFVSGPAAARRCPRILCRTRARVRKRTSATPRAVRKAGAIARGRKQHVLARLVILPVVQDEPDEEHIRRRAAARQRLPRLEEVARAVRHPPRLEQRRVARAPRLPKARAHRANQRPRKKGPRRVRTHGLGGRDDLRAVLDDDADVRVALRDDDRRRADPAADVDEHRALGERVPREPCRARAHD